MSLHLDRYCSHKADYHRLGVPKDVKRSLGERAVETMGENKASDFVKDAINQLPEDNRLHAKENKSGDSRLPATELKGEDKRSPANELKSKTHELTGNTQQNLAGDGIWEIADPPSKVGNNVDKSTSSTTVR